MNYLWLDPPPKKRELKKRKRMNWIRMNDFFECVSVYRNLIVSATDELLLLYNNNYE